MKIYVAQAIDYEEQPILGIFASEEDAWLIGNSRRRQRMNADELPIGSVWHPITTTGLYENGTITITSVNDRIFDLESIDVTEFDVE